MMAGSVSIPSPQSYQIKSSISLSKTGNQFGLGRDVPMKTCRK